MKPCGFCRPHAEHMVDRPDVDTPQGAEPTGTNGRRQHNTRPHERAAASTRLRTRPAAIARTATGDRTRNTRPPSGPQAARTPRSPQEKGSAELKIRGGHGLGETPGPIPNPEAKTQHGNGTAPGRVWESSTPPPQHVNMGDILGRAFLRMPPFFIFGSDQCLAVPVLLHKAVRETIKRSWTNTKGRLSLVLSAI